jgi:hypothetical protein
MTRELSFKNCINAQQDDKRFYKTNHFILNFIYKLPRAVNAVRSATPTCCSAACRISACRIVACSNNSMLHGSVQHSQHAALQRAALTACCIVACSINNMLHCRVSNGSVPHCSMPLKALH